MIVSDADASTFLGITAGDALLAMIHRGVEKDVVQFIGWKPERALHIRYYHKSEAGGAGDYFVGTFGGVPYAGGTTDLLFLEHKYVLNDGTLNVRECSGAHYGQYTDTDWETLTKGVDYAIQIDEEESEEGNHVSRSGALIRIGAEWPKSRGSVKVTYNAGFTTTELTGELGGEADYTDASDLRLAVLQALGRAYNQAKMHQYSQKTGRPGGLIASESIDGYSYSLDGMVAQGTLGMTMTLPLEVQQRLQRYRRYGGLFV